MMSIEADIRKLYERFFDAIGGVYPDTGIVKKRPEKRFATYPYIGSEYGKEEGFPKILFVGMDIGRDETVHDHFNADCFPADSDGRIQSFEERRMRIMSVLEKPGKHNGKHIPGTDRDAAERFQRWERQVPSDKRALSYVALTNFHKFVGVNREYRTNREKIEDRQWILGHNSASLECRLLADEVNVLGANVVVFQGLITFQGDKLDDYYTGFKYKGIKYQDIGDIFTLEREVLIGSHPSARSKDFRPIKPWKPWL